MKKFGKLFVCRIPSLIVAIIFSVTSTCYGIDLSSRTNLRVPLASTNNLGHERQEEVQRQQEYIDAIRAYRKALSEFCEELQKKGPEDLNMGINVMRLRLKCRELARKLKTIPDLEKDYESWYEWVRRELGIGNIELMDSGAKSRPVFKEVSGFEGHRIILIERIEDFIEESLREGKKDGYEFFDSAGFMPRSSKRMLGLYSVLYNLIENTFQHNNARDEYLPIGGRAFYDDDRKEIVVQIVGGGKTELLAKGDVFFTPSSDHRNNIKQRISRPDMLGGAGLAIDNIFMVLGDFKIDGLIAPDQDIKIKWYHLTYEISAYEGHPYYPVVTELQFPLQRMGQFTDMSGLSQLVPTRTCP